MKEKVKITVEQWEWFIKELKMISRVLQAQRYMSYEDIEDTISDVLEILVRKPRTAKYIYDTDNKAYLMKMFKRTSSNYLILEHFDNTKHIQQWKKIKDICDRYNIPCAADNAYKIEAFSDDKRLTIAVIEELLKEKKERVSFNEMLRITLEEQEKCDE